jgi:hypothetical protein
MIHPEPDPTTAFMHSEVERIKLEMLAEYDRAGTVDVAEFVNRYPMYREAVVDFWLWAKGTPREGDGDPRPFDASDGDIAEGAIRDMCLSVNLGAAWLQEPVDPAPEEESLARELGILRRRAHSSGGKAPVAFRKAAVSTWIVSILQEKRPRVTRLALQKTTYVLEFAMDLRLFQDHSRKKLGPYDSSARYKDAEPIAKKKGWLQVQGSTFRASSDASEWGRFAGRYLRSEPLARRLVEYLAHRTDAQLETLATVLSAAHDVLAQKHELDVATIRTAIAAVAEWSDKLARPGFSSANIRVALEDLQRLGLLTR